MSKNFLLFLILPIFFLVTISILFLNQRNIDKKIADFFEWGKAQIVQVNKSNAEVEEIKKDISDLREEILKMKNKNYLESEEAVKNEEILKETEIEEEKWCQKIEGQKPKREAIFNEICWMGDKDSSYNEWIELKNLSGKDLDLTSWQLKNKDEGIKIILEGKIKKNGFFILERGEDALPEIESDFVFRGAIKNENEAFFLFDKDCQLQDEVFASPNWPAGDNLTKRTAERKIDFAWQNSENPGGTPKAENSKGFVETAKEEETKINLSFPPEVFGEKEFEVSLSVSNLESKTYDVKISVESDSQILSEIFDPKNSWQSSNYYLREIFSGNSFSGNFKLKIKTKNFIGDAQIFAKIRDSKTEKIVAQFSDRIKIKQEETPEATIPPPSTSQISPLSVIINEIAWMGSFVEGLNSQSQAYYEWIELYNNADFEISLYGCRIENGGSNNKPLEISTNKLIPLKGFLVICKKEQDFCDVTTSSLSLSNDYKDNGKLVLICNDQIIDELPGPTDSEWPAGNNQSKYTMERIAASKSGSDSSNWATSTYINGTPRAKNSVSQ